MTETRENPRTEAANEVDAIDAGRVVGEPPSHEDLFLIEMGRHIAKESLNALNLSLRQFVTLSAALLAGCVTIYDKGIILQPVTATCMLFLLVALFCSSIGSVPYSRIVDRNSPSDISDAIQEGSAFKRRLLHASVTMTLLAMLLVMVGVIASPFVR